MYNQQSHPHPFMKASQVLQPKKLKPDVPDLEEAIEDSDDGAAAASEDEGKGEEEALDLKKDKYVKAPSKKKESAKQKDETSKVKASRKTRVTRIESDEYPLPPQIPPARNPGKPRDMSREW
ncbi:MAG: hypothetical protein Q9212_001194 [Teloschistes hypoglaucus]